MIIVDFGIDLRACDLAGNMLVHLLAENAVEKKHYWNTLAFIVVHYAAGLLETPNQKESPPPNLSDLLDASNGAGKTVREAIIENHAEDYFHGIILEGKTSCY